MSAMDQFSRSLSANKDEEKDNTSDNCIICDSLVSERQYHLWKSGFTKSSFCSRCGQENSAMRYISYWGTPNYKAGSWRKRHNAGRSLDIDLTPLVEVLAKIDNMNTSMGPSFDSKQSAAEPNDINIISHDIEYTPACVSNDVFKQTRRNNINNNDMYDDEMNSSKAIKPRNHLRTRRERVSMDNQANNVKERKPGHTIDSEQQTGNGRNSRPEDLLVDNLKHVQDISECTQSGMGETTNKHQLSSAPAKDIAETFHENSSSKHTSSSESVEKFMLSDSKGPRDTSASPIYFGNKMPCFEEGPAMDDTCNNQNEITTMSRSASLLSISDCTRSEVEDTAQESHNAWSFNSVVETELSDNRENTNELTSISTASSLTWSSSRSSFGDTADMSINSSIDQNYETFSVGLESDAPFKRRSTGVSDLKAPSINKLRIVQKRENDFRTECTEKKNIINNIENKTKTKTDGEASTLSAEDFTKSTRVEVRAAEHHLHQGRDNVETKTFKCATEKNVHAKPEEKESFLAIKQRMQTLSLNGHSSQSENKVHASVTKGHFKTMYLQAAEVETVEKSCETDTQHVNSYQSKTDMFSFNRINDKHKENEIASLIGNAKNDDASRNGQDDSSRTTNMPRMINNESKDTMASSPYSEKDMTPCIASKIISLHKDTSFKSMDNLKQTAPDDKSKYSSKLNEQQPINTVLSRRKYLRESDESDRICKANQQYSRKSDIPHSSILSRTQPTELGDNTRTHSESVSRYLTEKRADTDSGDGYSLSTQRPHPPKGDIDQVEMNGNVNNNDFTDKNGLVCTEIFDKECKAKVRKSRKFSIYECSEETSDLLEESSLHLDENDKEEQELSCRSRGYSTDFFMSRQSVTGGEIMNIYQKALSKRRPETKRNQSRRVKQSPFPDRRTNTIASSGKTTNRRPSATDLMAVLERADSCSKRTSARLKHLCDRST